jgi:hypothetical protein
LIAFIGDANCWQLIPPNSYYTDPLVSTINNNDACIFFITT